MTIQLVLIAPKWMLSLPMLLVVGWLTACQSPSKHSQMLQPTGSPSAVVQVVKSTVTGFVATLEDDVKPLPNDQIRWSTYWKLCWQSYEGAIAYELQTVTSEGTSPKLKRQSEPCFRLQAATGENHKSYGFGDRDLTLEMHSAQLGYRVRAVLDGNRVTEWSDSIPVGTVITLESMQQMTPNDNIAGG